jgi:hypothetical protein
VPDAVTESVKLPPTATVVLACGWVTIWGAATLAPLLLDEDELELELLLLLDDEEEDELLEDELELLEAPDELEAPEELELDELPDVASATVAMLLVTEPPVLVTTTVYWPASDAAILATV